MKIAAITRYIFPAMGAAAILLASGCGKKEPTPAATPILAVPAPTTPTVHNENPGQAIASNPNLTPAQQQEAYTHLYQQRKGQ